METSQSLVDTDLLETLRRRRAELRESLNALEAALAAPSLGDQHRWRQRVHVALVELSADFREHIDVTEAADGLHEELARSAPWLSGPVARLAAEHHPIRELIDTLLERCEDGQATPVDEVRESATQLLGQLVRHRQRGADLVYEACEVDIGGET